MYTESLYCSISLHTSFSVLEKIKLICYILCLTLKISRVTLDLSKIGVTDLSGNFTAKRPTI